MSSIIGHDEKHAVLRSMLLEMFDEAPELTQILVAPAMLQVMQWELTPFVIDYLRKYLPEKHRIEIDKQLDSTT